MNSTTTPTPAKNTFRISAAAIEAEAAALDKIHAVLDKPEHKAGLTAEQLSKHTELAIGRIREVLRASTCVLKRVPGTQRWIADWSDLEK